MMFQDGRPQSGTDVLLVNVFLDGFQISRTNRMVQQIANFLEVLCSSACADLHHGSVEERAHEHTHEVSEPEPPVFHRGKKHQIMMRPQINHLRWDLRWELKWELKWELW